jgi:outer membrane protein OmpA-like peptidoglycan-associated protein
MLIKTLLISTFTFIVVGCSPKTTVVLLDSGKVHNAIIVSTNKGSTRLNKIGTFVQLNDKNQLPSKAKSMSKSEINSRYATLFKIAPKRARTYIVYFKANSTELTEASKKILDEALKTIQQRSPCMVDVIGHTDTVGSNQTNAKVSLKRANYVKSMIEARKTKVLSLVAKGYGEEDLQMKTANNVSEAKNRNVEIFIK